MEFIYKVKISNEKYKSILFVESLYSLSLYDFYNKGLYDTLVISRTGIFSENIKNNIENFLELNSKILPPSRFEKIIMSHGRIPSRFRELNQYVKSGMEIYGHDHIKYSAFFFSTGLNIVEDGSRNYICNKRIKDFFWSFLGMPYPLMGYSMKNKKILLSGINDIPSKIKSRVILIDRLSFLESLNTAKYNCNVNISEKFTLLITQPLSEDRIVTEKEKLSIYKELLYKDKNKLVIKPHPREKTDYKKYFSDAIIINNDGLVESLIGHKNLVKVVTLCSTGINSFKLRRNLDIVEGDMNKYPKIKNFLNIKG
ncbi:hypothetical protein HPQ32_19160 [Photobacterium carnosum]|uniref:glycosyltransferase family 52 n=1 Tax=Photobacterium carnosum TaxID=2023717 RepID=UPI001C90DFD5|nr:glycosyltransferase family 52 [Photobacterium carnosum]MBY3790480.1 hypothetical protein [Photobacterium carnosum]MCD9535523.1 hypothetical protein [Photobacterium carnosum]